MNENNKKDNFYSVETILKNKIAPELYSHYDELASVKFVVTINETEKKVNLNFENEIYPLNVTEKILLQSIKEEIHETFLKEHLGVKFCYENSKEFTCFCFCLN